jgi:hypothetical protein
MKMQSLEGLLNSSLPPICLQNARAAFRFSRRDRLFLAATLASSVLQFHGSWLKYQWGNPGILFPKTSADNSDVEHPYLSGHQISKSTPAGPAARTTSTSLIKNEVLFPLGLVLVELYLCQSIFTLLTHDDDDPVEAIANWKTATRVLQERVYYESGFRYGDAVDKCLSWSETRNSTVDDDDFQQLVFQKIVSPLFEDVRNLEGKSRIH